MAYTFDWSVLWLYRHLLLAGLLVTVQLSLIAFVLSLALGVIVAVGQLSRRRMVRTFFTAYVEFFRNIPLVVQLFYWYFAIGLGSFVASVVGLVLYSSVYIGEVIRSGVQSIPVTQYEAAYSSGLSSLRDDDVPDDPQALMIVIPPLGTELINVVKNSAVAMTVAVQELTFQTQEIDAITFRGFEATTAATVLYLLLALTIVGALGAIERAVKIETKVL
jgi:polar amino acid transport system permease protein